MPDNVDFQSATPATPAAGTKVSTEEVTTLNGLTVTAQQVQRVAPALITADGTAIDLPGDSANGLDIDVTRLPALAAGTNNIGDVDVLTLPELPAGDNNIGNVDVLTLPALPTGTNTIGSVDVLTLPAIPAGTNNIGDVDVLSLPALPTGTNNIGDVDVLTLPALSAGTNNIGDVDVLTLPAGTVAGSSSLPTGTNNIGDVDVLTLPALPAGTNNIGDVDVLTLPALPAGNNNIGDVDIASSVLPTGAATETTLGTRLSESDFDSKTGALTETAPATDIASSGLNGRLQRVAQRLTSLVALFPTSLGTKTAANSLSVSTASDDALVALQGAVTETAPATDIASSGLNGRLQRIAQRLTSLIALVPTSLDANGYFRVGAGGYAKKPAVTLTRGNNTTAYSVGDEVATTGTAAAAITVARVNAGTGFIVGGRIAYSNAPTAVVPDFVILVFGDTVTLAGDNAQLALSDADAAKYIGALYTGRVQAGSYSAGAIVTSGNYLIDMTPLHPIAFEATASVATLYLAVITLSAYTPIAVSETLTVCLDVDRD